ncbi:hypothetical protein [Sphingomonas sp.]|uniref:hypothetical protein n=1 Tax=Sphingomonas sp. TaxID=28214 RepID=UPI0011503E5D|nr:hypothetical protein [Sphingomonas sp.]
MDQLLYVLAIMGCSDDAQACRQVRLEPVNYTSQVACQEAMEGALRRATDVDYPVVQAACQRRSERLVSREPQQPVTGG